MSWLEVLRCPVCRGGLARKSYEDDREGACREGLLSCSACALWFPIRNGVPRMFRPGPLRPDDSDFVAAHPHDVRELGDAAGERTARQVQTTFGYKWTRQNWWGMEGESAAIMEEWLLPRYGWNDRAAYVAFLGGRRRLLDAGCGLGREALRMAEAAPDAAVVGLELSECVDEAEGWARKRGRSNVRFVQADLNEPPFAPETFDFAISEGVLHHTPDTRAALTAVQQVVRPGGEIGFYVYNRKAPLREYADDYVRDCLKDLAPEAAWGEMESLTRLGKALSDLHAEVVVPEDVPVLGIRAGRHDVQRLVYYNIFKCYWNDRLSFDENVHVNFDWYAPRYSWRHTPDEVRRWLRDSGWTVVHERVEESGITMRARRP